MNKPYIGIVGIKNIEEGLVTARIIDDILADGNILHQPQIGVQVTDRTLRGEITESRRNPKVVEIPDIFTSILGVRNDIFNVVHYTAKDSAFIHDSVCKIFQLGDMYEKNICRGLQLNGNFGKVTPEIISRIKASYPELKIILQIPGEALTAMSGAQVIGELVKFNGLADYTLIDPSGGRGQEMNVQSGIQLAEGIMENTFVGAALAGGLNFSNVGRVIRELREGLGTNNFSIDAEGGLRDKVGEGYGNDDFNPKKAEDYFRNAVRAFEE